jgi:hypothetical protein
VYISKEVFGKAVNRYVVNIQFIPFYEEQKEIKWPLELGKFYLVRRHSLFAILNRKKPF